MMADVAHDSTPTPQSEASMSQLSIQSSNSTSETEDWDRSASDITMPRESPRTPSTSRIAKVDDDTECTPGGTKGRRSLSDLLKLHAEKGKDLKLSKEDEQRLSEELGQWINSDSSPYEPDDDFFSRVSRDDSELPPPSTKTSEVNMRPRGRSESVLSLGGQANNLTSAGEPKT